MTELILKSIKQVGRPIVAVIGFTVLLIGIAIIILPGPAFIIIPIGLAILATKFIWARKLLKKVKSKLTKQKKGQGH